MRSRRISSRHGFSLLELMIAVSIIATLAVIGIQQYGLYLARSRRPEAELALAALWDAQKHFYEDHGEYASSWGQLNFTMQNGTRVSDTEYRGGEYTYQLSRPNGAQSWYCVATGNIDGDAWLDVLITGIFW